MDKTTSEDTADRELGEDFAVDDAAQLDAQSGTEPAEPVDELTAARNELAEVNDKWMRLQADFQNHRRNAQGHIDAAVLRARTEVLGEAVTILDYLDMALATEVTSDDAKNLKIGVEMTRGQLQGLFDRMGLAPIDATGTFDPLRHQAVSTVATDEVEPGTIVEAVRGGWTIGDSVLRFAQVRVAAAPEASAAEAPTDSSLGAEAPAEEA